jgi:hypothetical protein
MECIVRGGSIPDEIGVDLEPAVKLICGYNIGERCLQPWNEEFAVIEDEEDVVCPMCRVELRISQYSPEICGAVLDLMESLRGDPASDREVDQLLLNAAKEDVRHCYGLEFGVMLAKLSGRLGVVGMLFTAILGWIDGRERSARSSRGHTLAT